MRVWCIHVRIDAVVDVDVAPWAASLQTEKLSFEFYSEHLRVKEYDLVDLARRQAICVTAPDPTGNEYDLCVALTLPTTVDTYVFRFKSAGMRLDWSEALRKYANKPLYKL